MVSSRELYKFGEFVLRPQDYVLTREGKPVSLTPKMFDVLLVLVRNHGRILGKDDLMKAVWTDSVVEEGNLAVIIRQLRKAFDDDAHNPAYIETVARRGYRFIADVRLESGNGILQVAISDPVAEVNREHFSPAAPARAAYPPEQTSPVVALADWRPAQQSDSAREESDPPRVRLELVPSTKKTNRLPLYLAGGALCAIAIVAGLYIFGNEIFSRRVESNALAQNIGVVSVEKLTDVGNVNAASISPDGKMLAYVTVEAGQHIVWLRQLANGKSLQIVPPTSEAISSIGFSRDGERLNYVGRPPNDSTHLNYIPILGGPPVRTISALHGYDISPNGRSIAFTRFGAEGSSLLVADSDGANERTLLSIAPPRHIISVAWSPGGNTITYGLGKMRSHDNDFAVMEFDIRTGEQRSLTDFRWNVIEKVAWLPDGSGMLLSARDVAEGNDQLWLLSLPDGGVRQISFDSSSLYLYNASDDLTKIVASQSFLDSQIWISPAGAPSSPQPLIAAQLDVAMTPDGRVIFPAKDSVGADIWMMNRDGTDRRQLTHDASVERHPVASPDGKFIIFVSSRSGKQNIWKMDLAGGTPVQLTHGAGEHYPALTPDGRSVLFNSLEDGSLWRVSVEGGEPVKILSDRAMRVAVSPDGKEIAYFGRKENKRILIVRDISDGSVVKEFDAAVWLASPPRVVWERSGRSLMYQSGSQSNVGNLMRQPLDGSPPIQLTDFKSLQIYDFYLSANGELAFVRGAWKFDAVLLTSLK